MKLQKLLSYVRRAVDDYQMIAEGDKIAVGVSGGRQRTGRRTPCIDHPKRYGE